MPATSVSGRPSISSVGTLPSGLMARNSGVRCSRLPSETGRASNGAPISCSAMWAAIELAPGAKYRVSMMSGLGDPPALPLPVRALALLREALDRDDALALGGVEHDHALRGAAGNSDAVDRAADQLAAIGHQHDLVALLDRERGDDAAVALGHVHRDDAFAAAAGGAVLVRRGTLAEPVLRDREHEL